MQFKEDAKVLTANGQEVGRVDRVVIDPKTKEATHVVVRKGLFFTEDKVVPISLIAAATEEQVTLREAAGDLQALPNFEETHFIPVHESELARPAAGAIYAPSLYSYPPFGGVMPYPAAIEPAYITETEEHIPPGTVALKEGANVVSADGKHVGNVEQVLTDPQADRVTHFVISEGLLLKERKLVPMGWVSGMDEKEVRLAVGSWLLDELRPYSG
jgi:uncharacterized protein YrrD